MTAPIVTTELGKRFRRRRWPSTAKIDAVVDVSLEVPEGTVFGLVGPNGAGKTTLMRLVLGLSQPTTGDVRLLGQPHSWTGSPALRHVGTLIEEPRFFPYLTARQNLMQIALLLGGDATDTVDRALADVGLADRADDRVKTFSLGMRQRLGLARCFLGRPRVLVLDEPTNGMDPQGIAETRLLLQRFVREQGGTVLLSSHLLDGVQQMCDHVAFMDAGRIVRSESMSALAAARTTYRITSSRAEDLGIVLRQLADGTDWALVSVKPEAVGEGADRVTVTVEFSGTPDPAQLNRALVERDFDIAAFTPVESTLESVYLDTIGTGYGVEVSQ